eukprot:4957489-Prymnesium_polylepis.1
MRRRLHLPTGSRRTVIHGLAPLCRSEHLRSHVHGRGLSLPVPNFPARSMRRGSASAGSVRTGAAASDHWLRSTLL